MARIDTLTNFLTDVADAIRLRRRTSTTIEASNFDKYITNLPDKGIEEKDVNFYDYDGALLYSYSKSDFLLLESMPENPQHAGLTSNNWNWTLSDAKTYLNTYNKLNIGQQYTPTDGKTKIYIEIEDTDMLDIYLAFSLSYEHHFLVEWGDGTSEIVGRESMSAVTFFQHSYSSIGKYTISISYAEGTTYGNMSLTGGYNCTILGCYDYQVNNGYDNYRYLNMIKHVELNDYTTLYNNAFKLCGLLNSVTGKMYYLTLTTFGDYAFRNCSNLKHLTIFSGVTGLGSSTFQDCTSLRTVSLPKTLADIGEYTFQNCYSLEYVNIPSEVTSLTYNFYNCYNLKYLEIPSGVTNIGDYTFRNCYNLKILSNIIPSGVTTIGQYAFSNCYNLTGHVTIPSGVTSIGSYAFQYSNITSVTIETSTSLSSYMFRGCRQLKTVVCSNNSLQYIQNYAFDGCVSLESISLPSSYYTVYNYTFRNCTSLKSINTRMAYMVGNYAFSGSGLESFETGYYITRISQNAFSNCASLQYVKFGSQNTSSRVSQIDANAFSGCTSVEYYDFTKATSIPTLGTNVFTNIPDTCKIVVPDSLYNDWIAASNWSTWSDYIIKASDWVH